MGWLKIRMPDRTWRSISKAAGPPDAQGVLKVLHWDGTWVQHADSSTPDAEAVYLRRGSSWERALWLAPATFPELLRTNWDLSRLAPYPHFQILHRFGTDTDNKKVDEIVKYAHGNYGFTSESTKEVNWGGVLAKPAQFSTYRVGHTTVDLGLILRSLPGEPTSAVIEFEFSLYASAQGSASNPGLDNPRINFPYRLYNAHIYETTDQPTLTWSPITNPYSFTFRDVPTGRERLTSGGDVLVVDDAGFIVSGKHIGSVNFWDDTAWYNGGYGSGWYRVAKPGTTLTRRVTGRELATLDHLDFAIYCDEIEAPAPTKKPNRSDLSWNNDNVLVASAVINVTTYERA